MKNLEISDLNKLYNDGEQADNSIFAEMRSNILLQNSEHYKKIQEKMLDRLRDTKLSEQAKLRLVKNYIQLVTKTYINGIMAPGVRILPWSETEMQDVADAELSQLVWEDAESKQEIDEKIERWAESFVVVGECAAQIMWKPNAGRLVGYEQEVSEAGEPLFNSPQGPTTQPADAMGNQFEPLASKRAVFEGELQIEPLHPFNIIRQKGVQSISESPWLCVRQMLQKTEVQAMVNAIPDKEERAKKLEYITESCKTTFKVFDASSGDYNDSKDQVLVKFMYFRPSGDYPEGCYYIFTEAGVLFGPEPLPFGIFPVVTEAFDLIPTSPRGRSIIKPLRGPQAEINRMASAISQTQIVHGRNMIITQVGSKLSKGNQWAEAVEFSVNGPPPTVIQGSSGSQFEASLEREIREFFRLANLDYELQETQVQDPQLALFRSLAQKKKFTIYARRFERFLCKVAKLYLQLAKRYLSDEYLQKAVGKRHSVNIAEFRRIDDEGFNIKMKPVTDDETSLLGKRLDIQTVLQYVGKDLPENVKGKMMRAMPFLNEDKLFGEMTLHDENVENAMLKMERGQFVDAKPADKHEIFIDRLNHRMNQADFEMLPPQVQQMYQAKLQQHMELQAEQLRKLQEQQAGYWPTGGGLVKIDIYDKKTGKRMLVPQEALQKLVDVLESQGTQQDILQQLDQQNQLQIMEAASQMSQNQQQQPAQMQPAGDPLLQQPA